MQLEESFPLIAHTCKLFIEHFKTFQNGMIAPESFTLLDIMFSDFVLCDREILLRSAVITAIKSTHF